MSRRIIYTVFDMTTFHGSIVFKGSYEECEKWIQDREDPRKYKIMH